MHYDVTMNPSQARAMCVRGIFAAALDRSIGGMKPGLRLRADLDLRGRDEDEISWRISNVLGVTIAKIEWADFYTVADVIMFVQLATAIEQGVEPV